MDSTQFERILVGATALLRSLLPVNRSDGQQLGNSFAENAPNSEYHLRRECDELLYYVS